MNPDFIEKNYTAEVIRTSGPPDTVMKAIAHLCVGDREQYQIEEPNRSPVHIFHGFVSTQRQFHRAARTRTSETGSELELPRRQKVRGVDCFLYDILVAHDSKHVVVAVPFHEL